MANHGQEQRIPTVCGYDNTKVDALINGHVSIDSSWTEADFAALAVAAADQAGASVREQMQIAAIVATTEGEPMALPVISADIRLETKRMGTCVYHRYVCTSCDPQRVGTWLHSLDKCAENAAAHSRWHQEGK